MTTTTRYASRSNGQITTFSVATATILSAVFRRRVPQLTVLDLLAPDDDADHLLARGPVAIRFGGIPETAPS